MNNRYREEENEQNTDQTENIGEDQETSTNEDSISENTLESAQQEANKYKDLYLRTRAETENFKKRIEDERIKERKYASQRLLEKLINSLDIFDKAVNMQTDDEKLKNFLIGFQMINNTLKQTIEEEGVKKIITIGEKFDPRYHYAVETVNDPEKEDNIVINETQSGYMYKDRVLRPAFVTVNKLENNKEEK